MRLQWRSDDGRGRAALSCDGDVPGPGPVVTQLLLDAPPAVQSFDRIAVAGVLAFRPWLSGTVELPGAVSPRVAAAIDVHCDGTAVRSWPATVNEETHITSERRLLVFGDGERPASDPGARHTEDTVLHIRRSDRFAGSLMALEQVVVASNAFTLSAVGKEAPPFATLALAVATLFAEDLAASSIELSGSDVPDDEDLAAVADLLASVDLSLRTD